MIIKSISITNFRGFKDKQTLYLADNNQITFLVGQNNAGKSLIPKVLGLLQYNNEQRDNPNEIQLKDFHAEDSMKPILIEIEILNFNFEKTFHDIIFTINIYNNKFNQEDRFIQSYKIRNMYSKSLISDAYEKLKNAILLFEPIRTLEINAKNPLFKTGKESLEWFNNPSHRSSARELKEKIKTYLQQMNLEAPNAVAINTNDNCFEFTFNNEVTLNSNDIGTGYTMLYILLAEILRNQKQLVVIDEIESHLHPGLIKQLIDIIRDTQIGDAQYIIATHSPTVMQTAKDGNKLYRFYKKDNQCFLNQYLKMINDSLPQCEK